MSERGVQVVYWLESNNRTLIVDCALNWAHWTTGAHFVECDTRERRNGMEWYLMVWRKYAEFDGRARRQEYWMFILFNLLALLPSLLWEASGSPSIINYGVRPVLSVFPLLAGRDHSRDRRNGSTLPRHRQKRLDAPALCCAGHHSRCRVDQRSRSRSSSCVRTAFPAPTNTGRVPSILISSPPPSPRTRPIAHGIVCSASICSACGRQSIRLPPAGRAVPCCHRAPNTAAVAGRRDKPQPRRA